jgi:hypothetical protein
MGDKSMDKRKGVMYTKHPFILLFHSFFLQGNHHGTHYSTAAPYPVLAIARPRCFGPVGWLREQPYAQL